MKWHLLSSVITQGWREAEYARNVGILTEHIITGQCGLWKPKYLMVMDPLHQIFYVLLSGIY